MKPKWKLHTNQWSLKEVRTVATKREIQEENETLREKLEEAYDLIGDALGFDDNEESADIESEAEEE